MPVVSDFTALLSGYSLHDTSGKGAFFTFSFPQVVPYYYNYYTDYLPAAGLASFRPLTEAEKSVARQALSAWAFVSGLTFFEVSPGEGDIQLGAYDMALLDGEPDTAAFAFYPDGRYDDLLWSDVFLDWSWAGDMNVLLHEIGHALGLKHPFEGDVTLRPDLDNYSRTVMSYTAGNSDGTSLGPLDREAAQYLYGDTGSKGTQVASWSWDPASYTLSQTGFAGSDSIFGVGTTDVIAGLGGNDFIQGRGGNDQLDGGEGDDEILGGAGNDRLDGGAGTDLLAGGIGDDVYIMGTGDTIIETAGEGTDEVRTALAFYQLADNVEHLTGTAASGQNLIGNGLDNIITGGAGHDILRGATGNDTMAGGLGNDQYYVYEVGDVVVDSGGSDTVYADLLDYTLPDGIEYLYGTSAAGQTLRGNALNNSITGKAGADHMLGGLGDDYYAVGAGDVVEEFAGQGDDVVGTDLATYALTVNVERLYGTSNSGQILIGNSLANQILGGSGDDQIDGGPGADQLWGGSGNDIYTVDDAGDHVIESPDGGIDEIRTALAAYTLFDGPENLTGLSAAGQALTGNNAVNAIAGGAGNDTLDGGGGADQLAGGLGNDVYLVDLGDVVTENANAGTDEVRTAHSAYALGANIENLKGTSATGQTLTGNDAANLITGGGGDDVIDGGTGTDQFAGGLGNDIYVVDAGDIVMEETAGGTDEVRTALATFALGANLETLAGMSSSGQALTGNGLANVITGGSGNDVLDGGAGADQLAGGLGNDLYLVDLGDTVGEAANAGTDEVRTALLAYTLTAEVERLTGTSATGQALTGNGLANIVTGGAGNDVLDGAAGADQLAGGLGDDVYFVDSGDLVSEAADAGTDEVRTALAAYTLAAEVERLTGISASGQALTGNGLANVITGGSGNDLLDGAAGADQLAGGLGNDVYLVGAGDTVIENAGEGTDEVRTALAAYTIGADLERLTGTSATGQVLTGNGLANLITGGGGNDVLDGAAGADQLAGGLGDDIYFIGAGDSVSEAANAGTDEVRTSLDDTTAPSNVEKLTGLNAVAQTLRGNGLDNVIAGGAGADRMVGGLGNDLYLVGTGDNVIEKVGEGIDEVRTALAAYTLTAEVENVTGTAATGQTLTGNAASNLVNAGSGSDVLHLWAGGGGNDTVNAGAGNDNIFFGATLTSADIVNGGAGVDTLVVQGPYGSLTLTANITQIENVSILGGNNTSFGEPGTNRYDYVLVTNDSNFAAGVQARINGSALLEGEDFTFNGSAETDASYVVYGGKGKDTLTGGLGNDIFFYAEERFATRRYRQRRRRL